MKRVALSLALALAPIFSSGLAFASSDTRLPQGATFALGGDAAYLLRPDGTTWAWGSNSAGQIGDGTSTTRKNPVQISINCAQISAGESFVLCIAPDSTLYSWGLNGYSQLGRTGSIYSPGAVGSTSDWRAVAAGYDHALAIKYDGTLYAWGNNASSQLGLNDTTKRTTPTKVGSDSDWIAVAGGNGFSLALKANGYLYGTGLNSSGQMANGGTAAGPKVFTKIGTMRWKSISAGLSHVMAINEDGSLYVWGGNANGQVGNGTASTTPVTTPFKITNASTWRTMAAGWYHSTAITAGGALYTWGANTHGELGLGTTTTTPKKTPQHLGTSTWNQYVLAGNGTTMLVEADGSLVMWGYGAYGTLGVGTTADHSSWVAPWPWYENDAWNYGNKPALPGAGSYHSMLVGRDGMLLTWGTNNDAQLGDGTTTNSSSNWTPQIHTYEAPWIFASGAEKVTHAIKPDGSLWGWGANVNGELGIASVAYNQRQLTPAQVGTNKTWVKTAEHYAQMIALRADGTMYGCGDNYAGLLGVGSTTENIRTLTKVVTPAGKFWAAVALSEDNGYGITTSGELYAWGDNTSGQLGRAAKDPAAGINKPALVDGGFTDWVSIGAGLGWAVAVRANGQAYTFGSAPNASSNTPITVPGGYRIVLLASSRFSAMGKAASGAIVGWGENSAGEIGQDYTGPVRTIQQTDYWGIRAMAGGADHFIGVNADSGNGHASGDNFAGQLGDGTQTTRNYPASITFPFQF
jgi:alpha-tubulin suppressor-like RCC1 family protein